MDTEIGKSTIEEQDLKIVIIQPSDSEGNARTGNKQVFFKGQKILEIGQEYNYSNSAIAARVIFRLIESRIANPSNSAEIDISEIIKLIKSDVKIEDVTKRDGLQRYILKSISELPSGGEPDKNFVYIDQESKKCILHGLDGQKRELELSVAEMPEIDSSNLLKHKNIPIIAEFLAKKGCNLVIEKTETIKKEELIETVVKFPLKNNTGSSSQRESTKEVRSILSDVLYYYCPEIVELIKDFLTLANFQNINQIYQYEIGVDEDNALTKMTLLDIIESKVSEISNMSGSALEEKGKEKEGSNDNLGELKDLAAKIGMLGGKTYERLAKDTITVEWIDKINNKVKLICKYKEKTIFTLRHADNDNKKQESLINFILKFINNCGLDGWPQEEEIIAFIENNKEIIGDINRLVESSITVNTKDEAIYKSRINHSPDYSDDFSNMLCYALLCKRFKIAKFLLQNQNINCNEAASFGRTTLSITLADFQKLKEEAKNTELLDAKQIFKEELQGEMAKYKEFLHLTTSTLKPYQDNGTKMVSISVALAFLKPLEILNNFNVLNGSNNDNSKDKDKKEIEEITKLVEENEKKQLAREEVKKREKEEEREAEEQKNKAKEKEKAEKQEEKQEEKQGSLSTPKKEQEQEQEEEGEDQKIAELDPLLDTHQDKQEGLTSTFSNDDTSIISQVCGFFASCCWSTNTEESETREQELTTTPESLI